MTRVFRISATLLFFALSGCATDPLATEPPDSPAVRGRSWARARCAGCHNVEVSGPSSNPAAPPFRRFGLSARTELVRLFTGQISSVDPHAMPQTTLTPGQAEDILAYLNQLQPTGRERRRP